VGKLLRASKTAENKGYFPFSPSPNDVIYDYTASGVRRSIEDSLQRLGIDSIDIAFVHAIFSDNKYLPTPWPDQFKIARKGAFPELTRMREEGLIKGWGIGVNTPEPIMRLLEVADPDTCLLASQYSLIDHKECSQSGISNSESKERLLRDRFFTQCGIHLGKPSLYLWKRVL
jgi:D-threo-aldose 1-dehydrogenase